MPSVWNWLRKRFSGPTERLDTRHLYASVRILKKQVATLQQQVADHEHTLRTPGRRKGDAVRPPQAYPKAAQLGGGVAYGGGKPPTTLFPPAGGS